MSSANKRAKLVKEGFAILGMVAEVRMKCDLFNQKLHRECKIMGKCYETDFASPQLSREASLTLSKMNRDLDRYERRLNEIECELKEIDGDFSKMA